MSDSGKTNTTFHILRQLIDRKIPFVFMDWKKTVRHLTPLIKDKINFYTPGRSLLKFPFNPFIVPPGVEQNVWINLVCDIMSEVFSFRDAARNVLRKAIYNQYSQGNLCPTADELITEVMTLPLKSQEDKWRITAKKGLESIRFSEITSKDRISQEQLTKKLLHENTVIELDGLGKEGKEFLVPILCQWIYYVRLNAPDREKLRLGIFIEEAHHVLHRRDKGSRETTLEMFIRQCRELGIGVVLIEQHPSLLSDVGLGNTKTTICLNQKNPADINKAAALSLVDDKKWFSKLPVGHGIVKLQSRWTDPVLVKIPLVDVKKGSVTDAMLARYCAMNFKKTRELGMSFLPEFRRLPMFDSALCDNAFSFLEDVWNFPDDGVTERYERLGFSGYLGNRIKGELVFSGWLEGVVIELGNTRKFVTRLTKKGKEYLGLDSGNTDKSSIEHEYWRRFYHQRYAEKMSYRTELEAKRKTFGNVDVLALKDGKSIAIEIETGKSDIFQNIRENLLSRYDRLLIVATNKKAEEKIMRLLAQKGLIIPGKIDVVLRDEKID